MLNSTARGWGLAGQNSRGWILYGVVMLGHPYTLLYLLRHCGAVSKLVLSTRNRRELCGAACSQQDEAEHRGSEEANTNTKRWPLASTDDTVFRKW